MMKFYAEIRFVDFRVIGISLKEVKIAHPPHLIPIEEDQAKADLVGMYYHQSTNTFHKEPPDGVKPEPPPEPHVPTPPEPPIEERPPLPGDAPVSEEGDPQDEDPQKG